MYLSRKKPFLSRFLSWYIGYLLNKDFSARQFNSVEVKTEEAVLLLANHFSWWDGFLMFQLNQLLFKKQFNVLINQEEYEKHWYLKYLGSFAAEDSKKDVMETLVYAGKLLDDPNNLVLVFPQGRSYPGFGTSVNFEKGVMQIINSSKKNFQFIFAANFADYFGGRKPAVHTYLERWEAEEYVSLQLLKSQYNKHYAAAMKNQHKTGV